jgi:hypothetical protein
MELKTVSNRMYAIITLFDMHTKYYHQALDGITEEDAVKRLNTKANHIKWLAGSLIQERYELVKILGQDLKSDADELFKDHKGIQDDAIYPTLEAYKKDWDKVAQILREQLITATDQQLNKVLTFPGMSFSVYEMVSFDIYREANCIGQIALWRRLLNYSGINYM